MRIKRHYSAEVQTTTQTVRASEYSIESTYSDFPCHLKLNRNKIAFINRPSVNSEKVDDHCLFIHEN